MADSPDNLRLLLVEFLRPHRVGPRGGGIFPFLRGWADSRGVDSRWVSIPCDRERTLETQALASIGQDDLRSLARTALEFRANAILLSEPSEGEIAASLPKAAMLYDVTQMSRTVPYDQELTVGQVDGFFGLSPAVDGDLRLLVDAVAPSWECEFPAGLPVEMRPSIEIMSGPLCLYARPLSANPAFSGLDLSGADSSIGCSFCSVRQRKYRFATPPVELAARQIGAALKTCPPDRWSGDFLVTGTVLFCPHVGNFLEEVLRLDVPESSFRFFCRLDEAVRMSGAIESVLPRLAEAGHAIDLFAMGVENFSQIENDRLNKGLSAQVVAEAVGMLRRWKNEYPGTVRFAERGLSFILFTPWTTLDDVRVNVQWAMRLGFHSRLLASRLVLADGRAITLLATQEGLVADDFEDPAFWLYDSGCLGPGMTERPWRFERPVVSALYGLCIRLFPMDGLTEQDALFTNVQELLRELSIAPDAFLDLVLHAIDVAEDPEPASSSQELLDRLAARLRADGGAIGEDLRRSARDRPQDSPLTGGPLARAVERLLGRMEPGRRWESGLVFRGLYDRGRAELDFEYGGESFVIWLQPASVGEPSYRQVGGLAIGYGGECGEAQRRMIDRLWAVMERSRRRDPSGVAALVAALPDS